MSETKKGAPPGRIRIDGVRLSFGDVFRPRSFTGDDGTDTKERFKSNFLIPKNPDGRTSDLTAVYRGQSGPIMEQLKKAKFAAIAAKIGEQEAQKMIRKIEPGQYAVRDGDFKTYDGYEGHWFLSAASERAPQVRGRDKRPLTAEDGVIYSGCYVNAIVTLWYQPAGKRGTRTVPNAVWAALDAIQFVRDGDAFGAAPVNVDEEFDDLTDESDFVDDGDIPL